MPVLVFKQSGRWANPPGQGFVDVGAGVPVDVCDFIAKNAIKAGRAEPVKPKPKAKKKELPSPVVKADEEKIGPEVKAEKAPLKPKAKKRTRKKGE